MSWDGLTEEERTKVKELSKKVLQEPISGSFENWIYQVVLWAYQEGKQAQRKRFDLELETLKRLSKEVPKETKDPWDVYKK